MRMMLRQVASLPTGDYAELGTSIFDGVRRAVDEFFGSQGIVLVPLANKAGTGIVIKPTKEHVYTRSWGDAFKGFMRDSAA